MVIGGLQKFSLCDYPEKVAAIVFTQGCNYKCGYCHNKELIQNTGESQGLIADAEVFSLLEKRKHQLDALVITGGEPTLQQDLLEFCSSVKKLGLLVKLDTNGSNPAVLKRLIDSGSIDFVAMDVKAPLSLYQQVASCQVNTKAISCSIQLIADSGLDHLFRTTWDKTLLNTDDINEIKTLLPENSRFVLQQCN